MKGIQTLSKRKMTLIEIQDYLKIADYQCLFDTIQKLVTDGIVEPIKSSGINGKKPSLYQAYRIILREKDYSVWKEELLYLYPALNNEYYLKHLDIYEKDRKFVLCIENYFKNREDCLKQEMSYNERSFEIFSREKFLLKEGGIRILKNLGLTLCDLNIYETTEPLAYYSHTKLPGQTILVIENKDTFYSMRKHLMAGNDTIFGKRIGSLIYGGGKAIYRSFQDFDLCVEPYMKDPKNRVEYFGDLDYEGILIYEQVKQIAKDWVEIVPFVQAYQAMIKKSHGIELPRTKDAQNRNGGSIFFDYFDEDTKKQIVDILQSERYIPQEILHCGEFIG